jgi:hypothetical protein
VRREEKSLTTDFTDYTDLRRLGSPPSELLLSVPPPATPELL